MVEEKKKGSKGLVVIIVILIILLLGAVGYICYDKFYKSDKPINPNAIKETKKIIKFEDAKIVVEEFENEEGLSAKQYLIAKINNEWKELDEGIVVYFGEKDNKLYYSTSEYFKYIDLNDNEFKPVDWIKLEEKEYASGSFIGYKFPTLGILKNDVIYYYGNSGPDKIHTLSLNSNKYSDIKKIGTELDDFVFYLSDNDIIYYPEWIEGSAVAKLVSFDVKTNERKEIISNNVSGCSFSNNKVLILIDENDEYKLYLYDLETLEKTYITDTVDQVEGKASIVGNNVYYLDGNNIMQYKNGNRVKIYNYNPPTEEDEFAVRGFTAYENDVFKYSLGSGNNDFFVAKNKRISEKDAHSMMNQYTVMMKNGKTKEFYDSDVLNNW